eukprot:TRINITY_DN973_c0_g1_i2.p1 TRINITY_DN973_c0_g1~~TRINITY_DN973_c0_g1_i2.p1  ORF type:complete len:107 (-),score=32.64 TRINITY_DN973_c0_g1_i2:149-469(-)
MYKRHFKFDCCGWLSLDERVDPCLSTQTCRDQVVSSVEAHLLTFGIIGIIVAALQIFAITFGVCYFCCLRVEYEDGEGEELVLRKSETASSSSDAHAYYKQKYTKL